MTLSTALILADPLEGLWPVARCFRFRHLRRLPAGVQFLQARVSGCSLQLRLPSTGGGSIQATAGSTQQALEVLQIATRTLCARGVLLPSANSEAPAVVNVFGTSRIEGLALPLNLLALSEAWMRTIVDFQPSFDTRRNRGLVLRCEGCFCLLHEGGGIEIMGCEEASLRSLLTNLDKALRDAAARGVVDLPL